MVGATVEEGGALVVAAGAVVVTAGDAVVEVTGSGVTVTVGGTVLPPLHPANSGQSQTLACEFQCSPDGHCFSTGPL